ncbi:MAG: hypothetical protein KatS3mg068_1680 [Candidatus Sericytochromatia bacterium]|nr:MAG: hypothetical protein KatS3mg068_1680 [Candidatus Sericytochromatia bacterium]
MVGLHILIYKYNELYSSNKYVVTNQETDINKIKYIYNGSYNDPPQSPSPKEEAWSNSMHLAWRTQTSSEGISYTHSRESTSKIEIPFRGTNIQVYQFKTPVMGQCNLKVYDSSNN